MWGVRVRGKTILRAAIDNAWDALHTPHVFRSVSAPFTVFRAPAATPLPDRFSPNTDYEVTVWALGIIPLGRQIIRLQDEVTGWHQRTVTDVGRGVSGPLSLLREWNHEMTLTARSDGTTDFSDTLTAKAGLLTPFAWLGLQVFWLWRVTKLRALAGDWDAPNTARWNARYAGKESMWSGKVNPVLEQTASAATVGTALDVGAGEGGDALWLAAQDWQVTAVDSSSVGVFRGHREASKRAADGSLPGSIAWHVADVTRSWPTATQQFDFVSLMFFHTDAATRESVWQQAVRSVARGGTLLIVGHDPLDAERGIPRPPAEMCFGEKDLSALIPTDWASVRTERIERLQSVNGQDVSVADVVLVATR